MQVSYATPPTACDSEAKRRPPSHTHTLHTNSLHLQTTACSSEFFWRHLIVVSWVFTCLFYCPKRFHPFHISSLGNPPPSPLPPPPSPSMHAHTRTHTYTHTHLTFYILSFSPSLPFPSLSFPLLPSSDTSNTHAVCALITIRYYFQKSFDRTLS